MKVFRASIFWIIVYLVIPMYSVMAQPGDEPPIEPIPIDGFTGLLLIAGALFGVKKIHEASKK